MAKKRKVSNGVPETPKTTIQDEVLKYVFSHIERDAEEWLEEEDKEEFEGAGDFLDFLDEQFNDDDFFKDLGHISVDWIENNIEWVFEQYKNRPKKVAKPRSQPVPIQIQKVDLSELFGGKKKK